jgi:hypothetical protein
MEVEVGKMKMAERQENCGFEPCKGGNGRPRSAHVGIKVAAWKWMTTQKESGVEHKKRGPFVWGKTVEHLEKSCEFEKIACATLKDATRVGEETRRPTNETKHNTRGYRSGCI